MNTPESKLYSLPLLLALLLLAVILVPSLAERMASQEAVDSDVYLAAVAKVSKEGLVKSQEIKGINDEILKLNTTVTKQKGKQREETIAAMQTKARTRKEKLLNLMEKDPAAALQAVMPSSRRNKLPAEIRNEIETPVTSKSKIEVLHTDNFETGTAEYRYALVQPDDRRFDFIPVGKIPAQALNTELETRGYQIENQIIAPVPSTALRTLQKPSGEGSYTTGDQKILVILVNFLDSPKPEPFTKEEIRETLFDGQVQQFYQEASYHKISWSGDVLDWSTFNRNSIVGDQCKFPHIWNGRRTADDSTDMVNVLKRNSINLDNYVTVVVIANNPACGTGGTLLSFGHKHGSGIFLDGKYYPLAWVYIGGNLNYFKAQDSGNRRYYPFPWIGLSGVLSHELGHTLFVLHANSLMCQEGKILTDSCTIREYGNYYDIMGQRKHSLHFNAAFKDLFGWFDNASIATIRESGRYTLRPIEWNSGVRAAKIHDANGDFPFYLEYKRPIGFDAGLYKNPNYPELATEPGGLFVNFMDGNWLHGSQLLDMSPLNSGIQVALNQEARAFYDPNRKITIGPVISFDENSITFDVFFGPPDLVITDLRLDPSVPAPGTIITLRATVVNRGTSPTPSDLSLTTSGLPRGASRQYQKSDNPCQDKQILEPGGTCTLVYAFSVASSPSPYTISVKVDPDNIIPESDETNNSATISFTVATPQPPSPPPVGSTPADLAVTNLTITPANPRVGESATFTATIENRGGTDAADFAYRIDLGAPRTTRPTDPYPCGLPIKLAAGTSCTISLTVTYSATAPINTAMVRVDTANRVKESDETNNSSSIIFDVNP